jgi:hypothetical protein
MEIHCFTNSLQPHCLNNAQASDFLGFVFVFQHLMMNSESIRAAQEIWQIAKDLMDSKVFVELSTTTSSSVVDFTQVTNAWLSAVGIKRMTGCSCCSCCCYYCNRLMM